MTKVAIRVRICLTCLVEWSDASKTCWSCGKLWVQTPFSMRWGFREDERGDMTPTIMGQELHRPL